jgi:SAM-dependent methyltransferase
MIQAPSLQRPAGPVATKTSLLQRLGAAGYDWLFEHVDPLGGADHRRRLVEQATGEVLEIGAGTGRNLPLYRTATRVVALEPGPGMRARATWATRAAQVAVEVVDGRAGDLPFPDATFDTVVASLVLCTVPDQPGRWPRPIGSCARAARCGSTSTSGPTTRGWPAGRAGWNDPGAGWPEAATRTATS